MENTAPPKSPGGAASIRHARRLEKNARKRAARAAARKRAMARKQRQAALGVFVAVVVIVLGVVLIKNLSGESSTSTAAASASPSTPAESPSTSASPAPFPPLPAGAAAALKTKPVVKAGTGTPTKLVVKTLIKGTGAAVAAGDTITVNYVGVTYKDGKEFDSSWSRSQAATFVIGEGQVIAGWDQGLVGVTIGSRVQLDIPQNLAYPNPSNGQPSGPLRFVVDILDAQATAS